MRRPIVFLLLAALAAMLASLVVYSSLKNKDEEVRKALAGTMPIVVAAHDIAVGAKIDSGTIKLARWPRNGLPPGAITDSGSVLGSVARAEFVENEPIVASRLVAGDKTSGVLPLMIPADMRAMSVAVDEVSDLSGFVLPYTKVDVLLSLTGNEKEGEGGRSKIILQNVPVLAVAQTIERKDNPQPERVVTLEVTPDQAEMLAVASTEGKLHLAMRSYGDNNVVATWGSDVRKVMGGYGGQIPEPVPVRQAATPVRVPVRRIVRRVTPLARIEVLRNGSSREAVTIGRNGFAAAMPGSAQSEQAPSDPSAYVASLGDEGQGSGGYGVESVAPEGGMSGGGNGNNSGGY
jgi:pilus assembly protein CpaB